MHGPGAHSIRGRNSRRSESAWKLESSMISLLFYFFFRVSYYTHVGVFLVHLGELRGVVQGLC